MTDDGPACKWNGREGFVGDPPPWDQRPAFALDADVTVWWPEVRPCWEESA